MANAKQRVVFGMSMVVAGLLLAVVASAYVVDRGWGKIAAAVIGLAAWPVVPVAWHAFAERRRAKRLAAAKVPAKSALTGFDRYWMRFVVIAIAVLAPMFYSSGRGVFGAVKREALWFWPTSAASNPLLRRVPADAEVVVVWHKPAEDGKHGGNAVFAWGARQAMLAIDGSLGEGELISKKLDDLNAARDKLPFLPIEKLVEVPVSGDTFVIATEGWRSKVESAGSGPNEELRGELARAPGDAMFAAAFAPRTKITLRDLDPVEIRHGVVWVEKHEHSIVLDSRIEARDEALAAKFVDEVDALVHFKTKDIPDGCRDAVGKIVDHLKLDHVGTIVSAHVEITEDAIMPLMFCSAK